MKQTPITIPVEILQSSVLADKDKIVYFQLLQFANEDVFCYPTLETLAQRLSVSVDTIKRSIRRLKQTGIVKVFKPVTRKNNTYLLMPIAELVDQETNDFVIGELSGDEVIESEIDFELLVSDLRSYYKATKNAVFGRKYLETKSNKRQKKTSSTTKKSLDTLVSDHELKRNECGEDYYNSDEHKISYADYILEFCCMFRHVYGHLPVVNWSRDIKLVKQFIEKLLNKSPKYIMQLIAQFVNSYERLFKTPKRPVPQIYMLQTNNILNDIVAITDRELENFARANDVSNERVNIFF